MLDNETDLWRESADSNIPNSDHDVLVERDFRGGVSGVSGSAISPMIAFLGGLAVGAAIMYALDPNNGRRRRAVARDKFFSWSRCARESAADLAQHASDRARGLAAETRAWLNEGEIPDETLVERVRAHMGHAIVHAGCVDVTASDGVVTLCGTIPADEEARLLAAVGRVRGVRGVQNELTIGPPPEQQQQQRGSSRQGEAIRRF
jgi:hypothetical protein